MGRSGPNGQGPLGLRAKMGRPNSANFYSDPFLLAQSYLMRAVGQNGSDIKILKLIINNNFTNFIFCKIKFL